jgi:hypothetical protein
MRPSGLIKRGRSASAFKREYLDKSRECFVGTNIHNRSKSSSDMRIAPMHSTDSHFDQCGH